MALSRLLPMALSLGLVACFAAAAIGDGPPFPAMGSLERLDPRFDKLVPPSAKLEILADGFELVRGTNLGAERQIPTI